MANPKLTGLRLANYAQFEDIIRKTIQANNGIVVNAAIALNVHRNTMYRWIGESPILRSVVSAARYGVS